MTKTNHKFKISSLKSVFDSNALWLSMLLGAFGYRLFLPLSPILPWLIFCMLFFTFCKVNPLDLRLRRWHWVVLGVQMLMSAVTYLGTMYFTRNPVLAQGLLLCFIMPTATAAPIIAGKLGGSIQNLTTFTLLSNFATAIIVPVTFPLINNNVQLSTFNFQLSTFNSQLSTFNSQLSTFNSQLSTSFIPAFTLIISRVAPLLIGPFFAAWLLRIGYNYYHRRKSLSASETRALSVKRSFSVSGLSGEAGQKEFELSPGLAQIPFYLWVASIIVLTAVVTNTTISNFQSQISNIIILIIASFFACLIQFGVGKLIGFYLPAPSKGKDYQDILINPAAAPKTMAGVSSITAGQAFGQKNTSLGVWMAQQYLDPMAALGAAAYIIWQNIFNSLQLTIAAHKK